MITITTTAAMYHPVLLPFLSETNLDIGFTFHKYVDNYFSTEITWI